MNESCFKARKEFYKVKQEFLKFPSNMGRRLVFMNAKKKYKKTLYLVERAFKEKNLHKIVELNKKNQKQFWTAIKSLLKDTINNTTNCIHPNSSNPYFQKLLNVQNKNINDQNTQQKLETLEKNMKNQSGPLDYDLTTEDIISTIKTLKLNKSNFSIVTNEVLKCNPEAIATPLCLIFNNILRSKLFPNLSLIKPIHKCGTFSKHDNYRGICISNHLSKLFTALLHKRLEKWSVKENVLPDNSLGFRKGLRTEDGIFILTTLLDKYAKTGERVFSCFVDFAKFYDSISHNLLFIKLAEKGISGNFYFLL